MKKEQLDTKSIFAYGLYDMLKEEKLDNIRVETLCKNVGLSKKSFYNYFKDKYDLAQYLYDLIIEETISVSNYYINLSNGIENLNDMDIDSINNLQKIFFSLRNTHKKISSNLVISDDYNSPQNYFDRQSIKGRINILSKRLEMAGKKMDQSDIELAGKVLYLISKEYYAKWDYLYEDNLPVEEVKKLITLTNDMIQFFIERATKI